MLRAPKSACMPSFHNQKVARIPLNKQLGFRASAGHWHGIWRYRALSSLAALFVFAVDACGAVPVITSSGSAAGTLNAAFSYQITASDSPQSYTATGLPLGLNVNASTGLISGMPTQTGTFTSTMSAINGDGTGSGTLTVSVQTVVAWPTLGIYQLRLTMFPRLLVVEGTASL